MDGLDTAVRAIQNQVVDDVSVLGMEILRRIDALAAEIAERGVAESKAERARVDDLGRDFAEHISEMIETFSGHAIEQVRPLWPGDEATWREVRQDYRARLGFVDHYVRGFVAGGGVLWSLIRGLGDGPWDRPSVTRCLRSRLLFVHERLEQASLSWADSLEARLNGQRIEPQPLHAALEPIDAVDDEPPTLIGAMPELVAPDVPLESDYTFSDDTNDMDVILPPLLEPDDAAGFIAPESLDELADLDDLPPLTPMGAGVEAPRPLEVLPTPEEDDEDEDDAPTVVGGRAGDDEVLDTMQDHHTFDLFGDDDGYDDEDGEDATVDASPGEALEALSDEDALEALPDDAFDEGALEALPDDALDELPELPDDAFEPTTAEIPLEALPELPEDAFEPTTGEEALPIDEAPEDEDTLLGGDDGVLDEEALPAEEEEALPAEEEEALPAEEEEALPAEEEAPVGDEEALTAMPTLKERFDAVIALANEWDIQVNNLPEDLEEDWVGVLEERVGDLVERRREKAAEEAERQARLESLMALAAQLKVRVKKVPERPSDTWLDKMAAKLHEVQKKRGVPPSFSEAADLQTEEARRSAPAPDEEAAEEDGPVQDAEEEAVLAQRRARIDAIVEKAERMGVPLGRVPDSPTDAWVVQTEAKLEQFLAKRREERKAEREKKKKERQERIERIQREAAELEVDIGKVPPFPTDDWLNRADMRIAQTMLKRGEERPVIPELEADEEEEESEELIPQIVYEPGTLQEQRWIVDRDMVIGRAPDSDIQIIFDGGISRRHCRIRVVGDMEFAIEDAGSTKGTMVDGERIQDSLPLPFGSVIQIGDTHLQFDMLPMEQ